MAPMRDDPTPARSEPLSIVVVGGSGDLAQKKIFPALFSLYCQGLLPEPWRIYGFARTEYDDETFRAKMGERLTCRYTPGASCADYIARFLSRCSYVRGDYGAREAFLSLYAKMHAEEGAGPANRVFYMAIPPFLFVDVAKATGGAGLVNCEQGPNWSRAVIEKPFGRDRVSSDALTASMGQVFSEEQTFRIDHYLGKEVIQNLLVLRFANLIFDPLWNARYIDHVRIAWQEDLGVEGRAGYFDEYGIVRDVVQNHLLQILALVAMERPKAFTARAIGDEKVRVLRCVPPVRVEDMVLGQYAAGTLDAQAHAAYVAEPGIPQASRTPTYAAAMLRIENERWRGVPFLITAGKGLGARCTEIRLRFRGLERSLFTEMSGPLPPNELIIRVQPDEAISLRIVNKRPGLDMELAAGDLDLRYASAFDGVIPDAYELLLLDVLRGDKSLFIRSDELEAAWDIFTPALHEIDARSVVPELYAFGSAGPQGLAGLMARHGVAL